MRCGNGSTSPTQPSPEPAQPAVHAAPAQPVSFFCISGGLGLAKQDLHCHGIQFLFILSFGFRVQGFRVLGFRV